MGSGKDARNSWWLIVAIASTVVVLIAWASLSEIDQIARSQGQVIAGARTQVIQSANDGVIEAILVREGEKVTKGQLLARLDKSQAEAAWQDSVTKVAALKAALARLRAEVFSRKLVFSDDVLAHPAFVANQTELFQRRQKAVNAEIGALEQSLGLVQKQLNLNLPLLESGDISKAEVIVLQKQVAEISGQITNRRNKYFQDAQAEMTKAEEDLATQEQLLVDRASVHERTQIVSPAEGLVRNILTTTPGAKVRPGDVIMELLPTASALIVEAKLRPADIAFVRPGLSATVKLDAFDYSIYGVLAGEVTYISPDALMEKTQAGEQPYYRVQIRIDERSLAERNARHTGKPIVVQPGMTASVDIRTGQQTVLSYLTKPLTKTISESLGER